jgi:DNA-binding MurR/RpiR family transcriptional regulator
LAKAAAAGAAVNSKAVLVKNIERSDTVEYVSLREAAREIGTSMSTIHRYIKSGKALKGVWLISIKENS